MVFISKENLPPLSGLWPPSSYIKNIDKTVKKIRNLSAHFLRQVRADLLGKLNATNVVSKTDLQKYSFSVHGSWFILPLPAPTRISQIKKYRVHASWRRKHAKQCYTQVKRPNESFLPGRKRIENIYNNCGTASQLSRKKIQTFLVVSAHFPTKGWWKLTLGWKYCIMHTQILFLAQS